MSFRSSKIILFLVLILSVFTLRFFSLDGKNGAGIVFAQEKSENLEKICQRLINNGQEKLSKKDYQSLLKKCQSFYEKQI